MKSLGWDQREIMWKELFDSTSNFFFLCQFRKYEEHLFCFSPATLLRNSVLSLSLFLQSLTIFWIRIYTKKISRLPSFKNKNSTFMRPISLLLMFFLLFIHKHKSKKRKFDLFPAYFSRLLRQISSIEKYYCNTHLAVVQRMREWLPC